MKFPKKYQLEQVCSRDPHRMAINTIYLHKEIDTLVATNGRIMAMVPCKTEPGESSVSIPWDVIADHRKARPGVKNDTLELTCHSDVIEYETKVGKGRVKPDPNKYPNYSNVWPDYSKDVWVHKVMLDPELLMRLAKGLGTPNEVTLHLPVAFFKDKGKADDPAGQPILVMGKDPNEQGILMPKKMPKDDPQTDNSKKG